MGMLKPTKRKAAAVVVSTSAFLAYLFTNIEEYVPEPPLGEAPLLICMAGNESGRNIYLQEIEEAGLRPYCDFAFQVNGPHDKFPEHFAPGEAYQEAYDRVALKLSGLDMSKHPEPFVHLFYDYEPHIDGVHWMSRVMWAGYTDADIDFINESMRGVRAAVEEHGDGKVSEDCAVGFYYLPRQTRKGQYTDELIKNAFTFQGARNAQDLIWVNVYSGNTHKVADEWTEERLVTAWKISREFAPESALAFWPRWSVDNKAWFEKHLEVAYYNGFDMDRVIIWTNPHTDFMAERYASWTLEAKDALKLFIFSEYKQRGWRGSP